MNKTEHIPSILKTCGIKFCSTYQKLVFFFKKFFLEIAIFIIFLAGCYYNDIIDVIEAITWPLVVCVFMMLFRKEIASLFDMMTQVGNNTKAITTKFFGLELNAFSDDERLSTTEEIEKKHLKTRAFQRPFITREEKQIKSELINSHYTPKEAIIDLIHEVANLRFQIRYLCLDKVIDSLHLEMLKHLNLKSLSTPDSELMAYYSIVYKNHHHSRQDYSYDSFMSFLASKELVIRDRDGYGITYFGNEYLAHRIRMKENI